MQLVPVYSSVEPSAPVKTRAEVREEMASSVVVALVEVELPVMFKSPIMVEEALEINPVAVKRPALFTDNNSELALLVKERNLPVKEAVELALIKVPVVLVALTWKIAVLSR